MDTGRAAERVRRGGRGSAARVVRLVARDGAETGIKKAGGPSGPRLGSGPGWRSCRQRLARVGHRSPAIRRAVGRQRASDEMSLRHSEEPSWTGRGWAICRTGRESRPPVETVSNRKVPGDQARTRSLVGSYGARNEAAAGTRSVAISSSYSPRGQPAGRDWSVLSSDIAKTDGPPERVPERPRADPADQRPIPPDRFVVKEQRLRIVEREHREATSWPGLSLTHERLPPGEPTRLVPRCREAETGLEEGVLVLSSTRSEATPWGSCGGSIVTSTRGSDRLERRTVRERLRRIVPDRHRSNSSAGIRGRL